MKNVILVTLDATRRDVFGVYGNKKGLSPFVDSLAEKSLVFENCLSVGPYTQASFPGLLTSGYFLDYGKPSGLASQRTLVSEPIRKAGFTTAAFHSNPYCSSFFGWNRGWDVFYDSMDDDVSEQIPYIQGPVILSKTKEWLQKHVRAKNHAPFFLWVHFMDVHEPYMPEQKYLDLVDPSLKISSEEMYALFTETLLRRDVSDETKVETLKRLYDAHVREVDGYVQDLFGTFEELDILRDSAVLLTSDHGDEFNEHGGLSHDDKLYSELVNVPLIVYGAGTAGKCGKLVSNVDIPPTILHLLDVPGVENFQGRSLLPVEGYEEREVYGEALDQRSQRGGDIDKDVYLCRKGDLKVIYRANTEMWELYDLKSDPEERRNLSGKDSEAAFDELKKMLAPRVRRWSLQGA